MQRAPAAIRTRRSRSLPAGARRSRRRVVPSWRLGGSAVGVITDEDCTRAGWNRRDESSGRLGDGVLERRSPLGRVVVEGEPSASAFVRPLGELRRVVGRPRRSTRPRTSPSRCCQPSKLGTALTLRGNTTRQAAKLTTRYDARQRPRPAAARIANPAGKYHGHTTGPSRITPTNAKPTQRTTPYRSVRTSR